MDQGQQSTICEIDPGLMKEIRKFRFSREVRNRALVMKVDKTSQTVVMDGDILEGEEEDGGLTVDDLREALPESQPRYHLSSQKPYLNLIDKPGEKPGHALL